MDVGQTSNMLYQMHIDIVHFDVDIFVEMLFKEGIFNSKSIKSINKSIFQNQSNQSKSIENLHNINLAILNRFHNVFDTCFESYVDDDDDWSFIIELIEPVTNNGYAFNGDNEFNDL